MSNGAEIVHEALASNLPEMPSDSVRLVLSGAVGSTLTGIETDLSDIDRMAIYAFDVESTIKATISNRKLNLAFFNADPDIFAYEITRFASLILKGNAPIMNFVHSENFEFVGEHGAELVSLVKTRFMTVDSLTRVFPSSARSSLEESKAHAEKNGVTDEMLVRETPKHTARKLKVAFVLLEQARQAIESGVYSTKVQNVDFFVNEFREMKYSEAVELATEKVQHLKDLDTSTLPFKRLYDEDDVKALEALAFKIKNFSSPF